MYLSSKAGRKKHQKNEKKVLISPKGCAILLNVGDALTKK